MAIAHRNTQTATGTTSVVVTKPTGTVDGDLLIASITSGGSTVAVPPAGWATLRTTASSTFRFTTFWKVAAGEGANFTFTTVTLGVGIVSAYSGFGSPYVDAENGQANASSTNVTAPGITVSNATNLLYFSCFQNGTNLTTPPSGMTERAEVSVTTKSEAADLIGASIGATGDIIATITTAKANIGHLVSFIETSVIPVPLATATGAGIAPTPQLTANVPVATADASAAAPSPLVSVAVPLATASGVALAPNVLVSVPVPLATATGAGVAPGPLVSVAVPVATVTGAALAPTVVSPYNAVVPVAAASGAAIVPIVAVAQNVPVASATGTALDPAPRVSAAVPVASAIGAAPTPAVVAPYNVLVPTAIATASALVPVVQFLSVVPGLTLIAPSRVRSVVTSGNRSG